MTVLGVDGCPVGWVGVAWGDEVTTFVALDIEQLVLQAMSRFAIEAVAIDTPIGLSSDGDRVPEAHARRRLPGRASTVFSSPALSVLRAETYDEANAANRAARTFLVLSSNAEPLVRGAGRPYRPRRRQKGWPLALTREL